MRKLIPVLALALTAGPAVAQPAANDQCAPYATAVAALAAKYHEAPVARMLADGHDGAPGFVIEILASEGGATFSVLLVSANGGACMVASGSDYGLVPPVAAPVPGTDS